MLTDPQIAAHYRAGLSLAEVAGIDGRCSETLRCRLDRMGVRRRKKGPPETGADAEVAAMADAGLSGSEIARRLGVSRQRIHQRLSRIHRKES